MSGPLLVGLSNVMWMAAVIPSFAAGILFGALVTYVAGIYASTWTIVIAGGILWLAILFAVCFAPKPEPVDDDPPLIVVDALTK